MKCVRSIYLPHVAYEPTIKLYPCFFQYSTRLFFYRSASPAAPCPVLCAYKYIETSVDAPHRTSYMLFMLHCRRRDLKCRSQEACQNCAQIWCRLISWINTIRNIKTNFSVVHKKMKRSVMHTSQIFDLTTKYCKCSDEQWYSFLNTGL